jgi:hypothetical protein
VDADRSILVWASAWRAPLVAALARHAGVTILGAGSPLRGQTGATAQRLGVPPVDDLRAALATTEASGVLLVEPGDFGTSRDDAQAVLDARARRMGGGGGAVLTLEPVPASAFDLLGAGWSRTDLGLSALDALRIVGLMGDGPGWTEAAGVREAFGAIEFVRIEIAGRPEHRSLGGHLFDAIDMLRRHVGEPETIHAMLAGGAGGEAAVATAQISPDSLRDLHGTACLHVRLSSPTGRAIASVFVSDARPHWRRRVEAIGKAGTLEIDDRGFTWRGPDGHVLDASRGHAVEPALEPPAPRAADPSQPTLWDAESALASNAEVVEVKGEDPAPAVLGRALRALLERGGGASAGGRDRAGRAEPATWVACQAALLSLRTGQAEAVATVSRMVGAE